jgi:hypothetical protein
MVGQKLAGLDDPNLRWLQQQVRVKNHPEWGVARVMRWYPASGERPELLRIMPQSVRAAQIVAVTDVELVFGT